KGDSVGPHVLKARRRPARTARDARVVKQDHLAVLGQAIGHGRVPVVHRPAEMLVEDERHAAGRAETAIGEADGPWPRRAGSGRSDAYAQSSGSFLCLSSFSS